jgi:hypothetical protein
MKTICIDFDGVIHSYKSGWNPQLLASEVADEPVDGAIDWLEKLTKIDEFSITIFSTRNHQDNGIEAMKEWLIRNGLSLEALNKIDFPIHKPPAWIFIDDRGFCFTGIFPSPEELLNFNSWIDK